MNQLVENQKAIVEIEQNILEKVREKDRSSEEVVREEEGLREQEEILKTKDHESRELVHQIQKMTEEDAQTAWDLYDEILEAEAALDA